MRTAQTQPLTCQWFTLRQTCVFRTPGRQENRVNSATCTHVVPRPRLLLVRSFLKVRLNRAIREAFNLTNQVNVINFASLFSGTAVGVPRSASVQLKVQF